MSDVTQVLSQIRSGDPSAAEQLLPLVYDELRRLAAANLAREQPGQTLQATALVHEAYLRLVDVDVAQHWNSRRHFFAAAAESMRRILVENARRKKRHKHGGRMRRGPLEDIQIEAPASAFDLLALDEALAKLAEHDPEKAEIVKLRYFAGLSHEEVAHVLGIPRSRLSAIGDMPASGCTGKWKSSRGTFRQSVIPLRHKRRIVSWRAIHGASCDGHRASQQRSGL